ncbi:MAG: helix-turn-helix transcriptional regulator [Bacilli bacterium]
MTVFKKIKILADKQKISIVELEEKLKFSRNSLYAWKRSNPSTDKLEAVANYFNVSTDYLLGRTENPNITDSEDPSMAKQVMMRMDTNGLSEKEIDEIESEMERFFSWRIEEIKKEHKE